MPGKSGLESLLGIHSLEGIRQVTETCGTQVLLMRLDGEVQAVFIPRRGRRSARSQIQLARLHDQQWPFLPEQLCQLHGEEMETVVPGTPLVCNFILRPQLDLEPRSAYTLVAIDETRNLIVLEVSVGSSATGPQETVPLPMLSAGPLLPDTTAQIVRRVNRPFIPRRLTLGGNPSAWLVQDLVIGNRSQFAQAGAISGEAFGVTALTTLLCATAQPAENITLRVTYIGQEPAPFIGALYGTSPSDIPSVVFRWTPEGRFEPWLAGSAS